MASLPPEINDIVLSNLSKKTLLHASTVCRAWYLPTVGLLYKSVELYSLKQLELFMDGLASNNKRVMDNKKKIGYLVRDILLHTADILLDDTEITLLKELCPLVTSFDYAGYFSLTDEHLCHFIPGWKNLKRLPAWHEDKSSSWIPTLGGQLIQLGCYMEELVVLPPLIKSTGRLFPNLVDLKIKMHYVGPPLTIDWMEMISDQCPVLESLGVDFMQYDVGDVDQNSTNNWKPAEKLRTLKWNTDRFFDPIWYNYLSQKYPNITQLNLTLSNEGEFPLDDTMMTAHKTSIFDMVTSFQQLDTFYITTGSHQPFLTDWYPWSELAHWLGTDDATRIKDLRWRTDAHQLGFKFLMECQFDFDEEDSDQEFPLVIWNENPLGNIKALKRLAFDVPEDLPRQISDLSYGALTLHNITSLELFFSRDYGDVETWQEVDMNTILDACPNITFLGLAGVISLGESIGHPPRPRLNNLRLHHIQYYGDDYMTRLIDRCPNLSILQLYSCFILRHPTQEQSNVSGQMTIDAPNHSFTLIDIRGVSFNDSEWLNLLSVKQSCKNGGMAVNHRRNARYADKDAYAMYLSCRLAETVIFEQWI